MTPIGQEPTDREILREFKRGKLVASRRNSWILIPLFLIVASGIFLWALMHRLAPPPAVSAPASQTSITPSAAGPQPVPTSPVVGFLQGTSGVPVATLYYRDDRGVEKSVDCSPSSKLIPLPPGHYHVRIEGINRRITHDEEVEIRPNTPTFVAPDETNPAFR